jgi:hypothetical protein
VGGNWAGCSFPHHTPRVSFQFVLLPPHKNLAWVCNVIEYQFNGNYSVVYVEYLGYHFKLPMYTWEALSPYWVNIAVAISKVLYYRRFSPEIYKDHKLWREGRMGQEALEFADLLTRDRAFRKSVRDFNAQVPMKYGENWLHPFIKGDSQDYSNLIAQLGQLIYNSVKFLKDAEYLLIYGDLVKVIRPYWCAPAEWALRRDWGRETVKFIEAHYNAVGKYPSLRAIAQFWRVPRYTLIDAGFTLDVIRDMYRLYRQTGEIKLIKPEKEYKRLTEEEQKQMAEKIARRIYH